ncbi:MAG: hypothetical protein AB8G77_24595 [Rhodothermales bacterium]
MSLPVKSQNGLFRQISAKKLKTVDDHIRKRRLDSGLKQKDVSRIIGDIRAMISAGELKPVEPAVKHIPKIIEFLGYLPFERGETPGQRIIIHRKTLGFNMLLVGQITIHSKQDIEVRSCFFQKLSVRQPASTLLLIR